MFSFHCGFSKREKDTCVNRSGMNAMFDIPYSFKLSMKFSTHMSNSTREKIGFSCTNYFSSILVLVFALSAALNKFRFSSLRNKMINLVLLIIYHHFDFRLRFDINKKFIFQGFTLLSQAAAGRVKSKSCR